MTQTRPVSSKKTTVITVLGISAKAVAGGLGLSLVVLALLPVLVMGLILVFLIGRSLLTPNQDEGAVTKKMESSLVAFGYKTITGYEPQTKEVTTRTIIGGFGPQPTVRQQRCSILIPVEGLRPQGSGSRIGLFQQSRYQKEPIHDQPDLA